MQKIIRLWSLTAAIKRDRFALADKGCFARLSLFEFSSWHVWSTKQKKTMRAIFAKMRTFLQKTFKVKTQCTKASEASSASLTTKIPESPVKCIIALTSHFPFPVWQPSGPPISPLSPSLATRQTQNNKITAHLVFGTTEFFFHRHGLILLFNLSPWG